MSQAPTTRNTSLSLGESLREFSASLKPATRSASDSYVRKFVDHLGETFAVSDLTSARVEGFVEAQIRPSDPAAQDRVVALKAYFAWMKKHGYTEQNFGNSVRVRKVAGRPTSAAVRLQAQPIAMTAEGIQGLREEIDRLEANERTIINDISVAREDKDFRENAPLDAAREALAFNQQRRRELESTLKRAVTIDNAGDISAVGSIVIVRRLDNDATFEYKLVGAREANAAERKISVESPVGRELLGRRVSEEVSVAAPSGVIQLRVEEIRQP